MTETSNRVQVAIVGGGFSGAMTAVHLLKQHLVDLDVTIIEPRNELGRGLAYSTQCPEHLLNVPAAEMSALPSEADNFLKFARLKEPSITADSFVPRMTYGDYVNALVTEQLTEGKGNPNRLRHVRSRAVDIERKATHYFLILEDGSRIKADYVVLALGNLVGKKPSWLSGINVSDKAYIHDPWDTKAVDSVGSDEDVLLVGSGLTAIDKIIELKSKGHQAAIYVVSRHGLFPNHHTKNYQRQPHVEFKYASVLKALKSIRERVAKLESATDWRQVIDDLRPLTQQWWLSLPLHERKRFIRHLQTYWDVHRHRMASEIGDKIDKTLKTGNLKIVAGRIIKVSPKGNQLTIEVKPRGKNASLNIGVSKIINCTGPQSSLQTIDSPLLSNLRKRGLIHSHILGTGIGARPDGQIVDQSGEAINGLFAIGPLLKAELMESVAVPELKGQAMSLADKIASLAKRRPNESALKMA